MPAVDAPVATAWATGDGKDEERQLGKMICWKNRRARSHRASFSIRLSRTSWAGREMDRFGRRFLVFGMVVKTPEGMHLAFLIILDGFRKMWKVRENSKYEKKRGERWPNRGGSHL